MKLLLFFFFSFSSIALAEMKVDDSPYVPNKREYSLELGTLWEEQTYAWLGVNVGFHTGRCFLLSPEHCQMYVDGLFGLGVRGDDLAQWVAGSLRWQFVHYPSSWSHFARLIGGVAHSKVTGINRNELVLGVGYGVKRYLHKNMDVRFEIRAGHTHQYFTQVNLGLELKVDDWVEYFASKIKSLGSKAIEATKDVFTGSEEKSKEP